VTDGDESAMNIPKVQHKTHENPDKIYGMVGPHDIVARFALFRVGRHFPKEDPCKQESREVALYVSILSRPS
jgi:hypothetical protein